MLAEEHGKILIRLARQVIEENLELEASDPVSDDELATPELQEHKPLFVTLNKNGQLRGCIGCLVATESIIEGIKRHTINAAFFDQRFSPLNVDELPDVKINISLLTDAQPLEYQDGEDLAKKLRPGIDGVIVRDASLGAATFLPQVWEQLPNVNQFLNHLCGKAGMPEDAWHTRHPEVQTYQVQYFTEA
jgi:AmmeMemoRadiSam system protein A